MTLILMLVSFALGVIFGDEVIDTIVKIKDKVGL